MKPTVLNLVSKSLLTKPQRPGSAHPINTGFTACHPLPGRVSHLPPPPFPDLQSSGQLILPLATALLLSRCHPLYYANYSCYSHYYIITELSENQAGSHSDGQEHVLCFPNTLYPEQLLTNGEGKRLAWFKSSVSLLIVSGWLLHC